ncbi:MAG TPA: LuxR C-terminal-related transcriptional regulator, partial [Candidatus Binatia bacterium]|nr:LuxR C-terminal-related transcriptional regulator [Candidatus Binatia bacterium]
TRLGPSELAAWHGRVAAALESEDVERDRLARHWAAAGETDRAAAVALAVAPELRAQGAERRAYECLRIATRRPPADDHAAAELFEEAALTAARIGEYDAMRGWIQAAQRHYRAAGLPDRAASMLLDPVFDYLPVRRSDAIRDEPVERLLIDAQSAMGAGRQDVTRGLLERAVESARQRSDGMALGRAARLLLSMLGEFERGEALLAEAAHLPDVAAHPSRQSRVLTIRACARFAQGYPLEAVELFRRGVAISRQDPEAVVGTGQIALANALMMIGYVEEGSAVLIEASRVQPGGGPMIQVAEGYRRFEEGEVEAGLEAIAIGTEGVLSAFDFDPLRRSWVAAHLLQCRAQVELQGGRPAAAVRAVRRLDALSPEPFSDVAADLAYVLARAGAELEDPDLLAEARRRIGDLARLAAGPGLLGIAEAVRGFAARLQGSPDEASRRFWAAASLCERAPRAVLAAELWCEAARTGQRSSAAALHRADGVCREYGLRRGAARVVTVRAELLRTPARIPAALAELTARERDVVLLAAEGLGNRDIGSRLYLSEGTVRNYLSVAFGKLGVSRRAELGRLVAGALPADRAGAGERGRS